MKFPMSEIIRQSDELQAAIARGEGPDPARLYVPILVVVSACVVSSTLES